MDYSDVLISHPELATEEEIEDWNRELFENIIDTTPSWWNSFTMGLSGIQPDAEYRSAFESGRRPANNLQWTLLLTWSYTRTYKNTKQSPKGEKRFWV